MKKPLLGLTIAGLVLVGQGCSSSQPATFGTPETTPPPAPAATVTTPTVEITTAGYSPAELKVPVGTTVTFINKTGKKNWPASAVHPSHKVCPGFDALKGLGQGESFSFTFSEKKECPYHDHLNPAGPKGKIIVE